MFNSVDEATAVLKDTHNSENDRVAAAHYLGHHANPAALDLLVTTLEDDDFGVHWAASEALAAAGDDALPPLLRALARPANDQRLRDGAKHVFHTSVSRDVRDQTKGILAAMHGSSQDLATIQAASDLMIKLHIA